MQGKLRPVVALGAALSTTVVVAGALALTGAPAANAAGSPAATAAAGWIESQLAIPANHHALPGFSPGSPDVGLTEDAVLALTAAGAGEDSETRAATAQIAANVTDFVSFDNFGVPDVHLAGPLAKTLLVAEVQGADPAAFGGRDIEAELRGTLTPSGADQGRFADQGTTPDSSNGFSQAMGILALLRTTNGVPADAVTFLLAQQCPNGGFRLFYDTGASCTANSDDDPDSTGLAVQALAALTASPAVTTAEAKAVTWLKSVQDPTTGSFSGSGPTALVPNTNSTGLAGSGLRVGGADAAADQAAAYVESLQLASGKDAGAIGYNPDAKSAVSGGKIGGSDLDQWRRASVQAILALGVPSYGQIVAVPTAPTSSTSSSSSSSSSSTSSSSSSSSSSNSSSASSTGSTTPSSSASVLGEQIANSADPGPLAATGGVPTHLVLFALLLLVVGIIVTVIATDRTAKHR